jgi:orotidine-5'-phosphate decarboxylase
MLNMHAFGGSEMMRRAADAVTETALKENFARPLLLAVTVLTSDDDATLAEVCAAANVESQVKRLAKLAAASAMDGVVASPHEVAMVRESVAAKNFVIVTPGVRPANTATHDQRRVMTPLEAMRAQANFIVVGRAILNAPDRLRAAHDILVEMQQA